MTITPDDARTLVTAGIQIANGVLQVDETAIRVTSIVAVTTRYTLGTTIAVATVLALAAYHLYSTPSPTMENINSVGLFVLFFWLVVAGFMGTNVFVYVNGVNRPIRVLKGGSLFKVGRVAKAIGRSLATSG